MTQKIDGTKEKLIRCSENFLLQEQRQLEVYCTGIQQITYSWAEDITKSFPQRGWRADSRQFTLPTTQGDEVGSENSAQS